MLNIELARIIQADREREIAAELRVRRLLRPPEMPDRITPTEAPDSTEGMRRGSAAPRRLQRGASTRAATR